MNVGWEVPRHLMRQLIEEAMTREDYSTVVRGSEDIEAAFSWAAQSLSSLQRSRCQRCGCDGDVSKLPVTLRGASRREKNMFIVSVARDIFTPSRTSTRMLKRATLQQKDTATLTTTRPKSSNFSSKK